MDNPGWLISHLDAAIDRMLEQKGLKDGIAEAEARAQRLEELRLEPFARIWRSVAQELRQRIARGLDA